MAEGLIVVKIGGSALGSNDTSLEDIASLVRVDRKVLIVHGGGPAISEWLKRLDAPTSFVRGLRVTDPVTLDVVTAVLGGLVNKQLVAALCGLGARALGMSGADAGMLQCDYEDIELGFVGRIMHVDPSPVESLMDAGLLPVVAPLALLRDQSGKPGGQLLNVNADTVAGELARALRRGKTRLSD